MLRRRRRSLDEILLEDPQEKVKRDEVMRELEEYFQRGSSTKRRVWKRIKKKNLEKLLFNV
jgi:hypothetical protein